MNINLIVAMSAMNRGIGYNGTIPWHYPEDLKRFSKLTKGDGNNAIIMGRKTWESLPKRPLPGRQNIVLSKTMCKSVINIRENELYFTELEDAIKTCKIRGFDCVWIIGGESIYKLALNLSIVSQIYVTLIYDQNIDCDTFFPNIPDDFKKVSENVEEDNDRIIKYDVYQKKKV